MKWKENIVLRPSMDCAKGETGKMYSIKLSHSISSMLNRRWSPAGVAPWLSNDHEPGDQGLIPGQGTGLSCRLNPQ